MYFFVNLFFSCCLFSSIAMADFKIVDNSTNQVGFVAVGNPGFLKINGTGGKASGKLTDTSGVITGTVEVKTIDLVTGIDTRDKHMREKYLGSEPIKFELDPFKMTVGAIKFTGKLLVKKDAVPVSGTGTISKVGAVTTLKAEFPVSLKDFPSIGVPSYMGITIAEKVNVVVQFDATE